MLSMLESLKKWFTFLPSNYSWIFAAKCNLAEIDEAAKNGKFPVIADFSTALYYAFLLSISRTLLTYLIFKPLAIYSMGMTVIENSKNTRIESSTSYRKSKNKKLNLSEVTALSKETNLTVDEINHFLWNKRRWLAQQKKITKFVEALWRFIFYLAFVVVGINTLYLPSPVPWVTNTLEFWIGWPFQPIHNATLFYYFVQLGAYLHQLLWTEVQRSDSTEMIIHHLSTIGLIVFSYLANFSRIGTVILLLHDVSDIFLESAKCFNYISKNNSTTSVGKISGHISEGLFAIFALCFFIARLVLFPRYVLYAVLVEGHSVLTAAYPGYVIFILLLVTLQCLHIFWFYLIAKMVIQLLWTGLEKDIRSDDEDEDMTAPKTKKEIKKTK